MPETILIESKPVESSQIQSIGYNNGILKITFHGGQSYLYTPVNKYTYTRLMMAESKGSFFASIIKTDETIKCIKL